MGLQLSIETALVAEQVGLSPAPEALDHIISRSLLRRTERLADGRHFEGLEPADQGPLRWTAGADDRTAQDRQLVYDGVVVRVSLH
jgi:hypothetical protein